MFCGNCGAPNSDESKFCLQCGAALDQGEPVYQDTGSSPKIKTPENRLVQFLKKRWMIVAPAVVVIVIALLCLNSIRAALDPAYAVERAADSTFSLLEKRNDSSPLKIFSVLGNCAKNGTIGMSFSYDTGYGSDVSGDISLLSNSGKKNYGLTANLSMNGEDLDLTALLNGKRLALNSSLIDDKYYGITFDSYDSDIKKFAEAAELDDYTVQTITGIVDSLRSAVNPAGVTLEKYGDLIERFVKDLKPATSSEQLSVGGETINCKVVAKEITEDDLDILLRDLYDMFSKDKELRDYLLSYFSNNNMSIGSLYGMFGNYNYDYYETAGEDDADTLYDTILDNLRDAIDSFKDAYSGKINMTYYISGNKLIRFQLSGSPKIDGEKASFDFSIDFGKNPDKDDITASITVADNDGYEYKLKATLASENKSGVQTNRLKLKTTSGGYTDSVTLKSVWTEKTGVLILSLDAGGDEYEIEGNLKYSNGGFQLVFDDLMDSSGTGSLELAITAEKGAKIPNPSYVNLDKWDSDLISDLEDEVSDLFGYGYYGNNSYYNDDDYFDDDFSFDDYDF